MRIDIKFDGLDAHIKKLDQIKDKEFNATIQNAFSFYMDLVKFESHKEIIRRTVPDMITDANGRSRRPTGTELYKMQPSTPGKLTSRTGRMVAGLLEGKNHIGKGWDGIGTKNPKTKKSIHRTLNGRMHTESEGITAWWSVFVRPGSIAMKYMKGQDKDMKQRIHFRYMWEHGMRGYAPKPYLSPANKRIQGKFIPMVENGLNNMIRKVGMR